MVKMGIGGAERIDKAARDNAEELRVKGRPAASCLPVVYHHTLIQEWNCIPLIECGGPLFSVSKKGRLALLSVKSAFKDVLFGCGGSLDRLLLI